ncbi:MAG: sigma 54-interacting transcriptional regulator [Planctomycetota bacterium]
MGSGNCATRKLSPLLGESLAIEQLRNFIVGVSLLREPVLLLGREGTGKALAARKIHAVGHFSQAPFLLVCCGRYSEPELAHLLFDSRGDGLSSGLLQVTQRLSCYLSGLETLRPRIVRRLLEWLDSSRAAGEQGPRLLFGSLRSYEQLRDAGTIDSALLDQLGRYRYQIPPLSERLEDIPILSHYQLWLCTQTAEYESRWQEFQRLVLPRLLTYAWPGNVRELNDVVAHFCASGAMAIRADEVELSTVAAVESLRRQFAEWHRELVRSFELERLGGPSDLALPGLRTAERLKDHV